MHISDTLSMYTAHDETLKQLMDIVMTGWPISKEHIPLKVREYWPYRDEISCPDGLIYRGTRVMIPTLLRSDMLERIHTSHLGVDASIRKARDCVFWPRMANDIQNMVRTCNICQQLQPQQQQEPMMSQPIPGQR